MKLDLLVAIVVRHRKAAPIWILAAPRRHHAYRAGQGKGKQGFRLHHHLLSMCDGLRAGARAGSSGSANSCAASAAGQAADDRSERCSAADLGRSILASSRAGLLPFISLDAIGVAAITHVDEIERQIRLAGELSSALRRNNTALHVGARGNHNAVVNINRRIEGCAELLTSLGP